MLRQPPDKLQNRDFDFFFFAGSVVFKVSKDLSDCVKTNNYKST